MALWPKPERWEMEQSAALWEVVMAKALVLVTIPLVAG